ncbi:MAG: DUF4118 domain-containing protein [Caldilineales bacterium]
MHLGVRRLRTVLLAGFLTGVGAALISAPIAAYVYGGVTGSGADYLTSYLAAAGASVLQAATIQGFISDPLDKMLSFAAAWLLWRVLRTFFTPPSRRGAQVFDGLQGYSVAVAASLAALLVSFVFLPAFERGIFAVFYIAVLVSAWRGGLGPALLTTAVGAFANIAFLETAHYSVGISAQDWLRVAIFVAVSLMIAAIADQLEQSKRRLHESLVAERASKARLRAVTDGVNEALALVSPDQRVVEVNRRFTEVFAVPAERVDGQLLEDTRTLYDQVFADPDELYRLTLASSTDTERDYTRLVVQNWPQPRELQLFTTPVRDADGFLGRLYVFRDVTHEARGGSHEDRVRVAGFPRTAHTADLHQGLHGDGAGRRRGRDQRRGRGVSGHRLQQRRAAGGAGQRPAGPVAHRVGAHPAQVRAGRSGPDRQDGSRHHAAEDPGEKGQSLEVRVDPAAANVVGDKDKLVQVLTNYVSNAHKYTQEGGAIEVEVVRQDGLARVAVTDNGHGIALADQARLFTRFYRVDNAMTRSRRHRSGAFHR